MDDVLITKHGQIIECSNIPHDIVCKRQLKIGLADFLSKRGGVRVHTNSIDHESIAIEFYVKRLTDIQMRIIHRILRKANYYTVVLTSKTIKRFRPIRGFLSKGARK